jgi:hypothetical protein
LLTSPCGRCLEIPAHPHHRSSAFGTRTRAFRDGRIPGRRSRLLECSATLEAGERGLIRCFRTWRFLSHSEGRSEVHTFAQSVESQVVPVVRAFCASRHFNAANLTGFLTAPSCSCSPLYLFRFAMPGVYCTSERRLVLDRRGKGDWGTQIFLTVASFLGFCDRGNRHKSNKKSHLLPLVTSGELEAAGIEPASCDP